MLIQQVARQLVLTFLKMSQSQPSCANNNGLVAAPSVFDHWFSAVSLSHCVIRSFGLWVFRLHVGVFMCFGAFYSRLVG